MLSIDNKKFSIYSDLKFYFFLIWDNSLVLIDYATVNIRYLLYNL